MARRQDVIIRYCRQEPKKQAETRQYQQHMPMILLVQLTKYGYPPYTADQAGIQQVGRAGLAKRQQATNLQLVSAWGHSKESCSQVWSTAVLKT